MKAFVTGGTGFIGSRVIQFLLERGYEVFALVRSEEDAAGFKAQGVQPVLGDITNRASMREGMAGSDVVFNIAGWYKLGSTDWQKAEKINVDGARNVLELAYELGVPKIVHTSTVAVFGDTHGYVADETYVGPEGPFLTEYDRTKWMAHYQVALPLIEQGAPIIIVMPGVVYGPEDPSLFGQMMQLFYKGFFPVLPGPELTLTYAHVDDIAKGHILAAEKGQVGESYLLTGPIMSMSEITEIWSQVSGRRPPFFDIPARFLMPFAPVVGALGSIIPLPEIISRDSIIILDATYIARSDKARSQLGWRTRSLVDGIGETFEWIAETTEPIQIQLSPTQRRRIAGLVIGVGLSLMFTWLLTRKRKK